MLLNCTLYPPFFTCSSWTWKQSSFPWAALIWISHNIIQKGHALSPIQLQQIHTHTPYSVVWWEDCWLCSEVHIYYSTLWFFSRVTLSVTSLQDDCINISNIGSELLFSWVAVIRVKATIVPNKTALFMKTILNISLLYTALQFISFWKCTKGSECDSRAMEYHIQLQYTYKNQKPWVWSCHYNLYGWYFIPELVLYNIVYMLSCIVVIVTMWYAHSHKFKALYGGELSINCWTCRAQNKDFKMDGQDGRPILYFVGHLHQ